MVLKPASTSGPVRPTFTAATLVGLIREALCGLPDTRKGGNNQRYAIGDVGLSAFCYWPPKLTHLRPTILTRPRVGIKASRPVESQHFGLLGTLTEPPRLLRRPGVVSQAGMACSESGW
jgi:hypothetical protein